MPLIAAVLLSFALSCDVADNNATTGLNYDCNNAGTCEIIEFFGVEEMACRCCEPDVDYCGADWICDPDNPFPECYYWGGDTCTDVDQVRYVNAGFRAELKDPELPADINCSTIPKQRYESNIFGRASIDFSQQILSLIDDTYTGNVVSYLCDTCSEEYPCTLGINENVNANKGTTHLFQVDINTFYNLSCQSDQFYRSDSNFKDCAENYDLGGRANAVFKAAIGDNADFLVALNNLLSSESAASNSYMGLGWSNSELVGLRLETQTFVRTFTITNVPSAAPTTDPTPSPTTTPTVNPTDSPTVHPTDSPTDSPTVNPTDSPTDSPTVNPTDSPTDSECGPYTNKVADLKFLGVGSNCRGGLDGSYPGGQTCDSPYLICLPQENTPAEFDGQEYKSSTHRYSVDECLQECANDQRCRGIEFEADNLSTVGSCTLIDDIPVVITSLNSSFIYNGAEDYTNLDSDTTGGALCFMKQDYCNPSFEAEDLNDTMLNCYCPNNRKGFYTKKVKRTVANTRFCGDDAATDTRVKKAHANRMFHLCENWCLFNADTPNDEAFYWDPWKKCFREQGVSGVHMSYCNRVIRHPDTIEMQFISNRVAIQCKDN